MAIRLKRRARLLVGCLLLAAACTHSPRTPAFSGLWIKTDENGITDLVIQNSIFVESDREKFRILSRGNEIDDVEIYNGQDLISQHIVTSSDDDETPVLRSTESAVPNSVAVAPTKTPSMRRRASRSEIQELAFWRRHLSAPGQLAGLVAGRPTHMFSVEKKDDDSVMLTQLWTDDTTGVVLRSATSVFSGATRTLLVRTIYDCVRIHYAPIDPAMFVL